MKKLLALFLFGVIVLSFAACSANVTVTPDESSSVKSETESVNEVLSETESVDSNSTEEDLSNIVSEEENSSTPSSKPSFDTSSKTTSSSKPSSNASSKTTSSSKPTTNVSSKTTSSSKPSSNTSSKVESSKINYSSENEEDTVILTGITAEYIGKALKTGDVLSPEDFLVVAKYSNNKQTKIVDFNIDVTKVQEVGDNTVTVSYKNKVYSITLKVLEGNASNANPGGEFGYEINDGELTITSYVGAKTDVVVPAWIDDMPVTAIKWLSDKVTSVVLPNSITYLERKAFHDCDRLVSVTIGSNIVEMGDNVFYHCQNLKNVTIKDGGTLIGRAMFSWCPSLENITLPDSIQKIEDSAFAGCENLKTITFPASIKEIGSYGVLSYCDNIEKIFVAEGSYAQRWCLNNGYGEKLTYI